VIVVDDGSIDGTPEIARQAGATVITSSLLGKGASMEDGVAVARGDIILFVDGDLTEVLQALAHAREAEQLEELEMGASIQGGQ
jgi:glycosyltransferase involved in cell wall biosynthesis